ncbi:hypothetical protein ES703_116217 [subsurface metagenome]
MNSEDSREIWDRVWLGHEMARIKKLSEAEFKSSRFRLLQSVLKEKFGSLQGLKVIEIGSGMGTNCLALSLLGVEPTLFDYSPVALRKAEMLFQSYGVKPGLINGDIFDSHDDLEGKFDVAMSFGLAEHFSGDTRSEAIKAHLNLVRKGGIIIVSVPNRFCPSYRIFMGLFKLLRQWRLGIEIPFSRRELEQIASKLDATDIRVYGTNFCVSIDHHILFFLRYPLQKARLPVPFTWFPDIRLPFLDHHFGYALLLFAEKGLKDNEKRRKE